MNLVKNITQYNISNVYFGEQVKNNILIDSNFIKIIYSDEYFSLNGIYLLVPIHITINSADKIYNKYRGRFNPLHYTSIINNISQFEIDILNKKNIKNKLKHIKITDQLNAGFIKILYNDYITQSKNVILKISGVWETSTAYGLTYKFIKY